MSQFRDILKQMAADVQAGKPVVASVLTAHDDINKVLTLFQIKQATRLVPDKDKPAAAIALRAEKVKENVGQRLKRGPDKGGLAIKQEKGRTK